MHQGHSLFWWTGEYRRCIEYPRLSAADCFFPGLYPVGGRGHHLRGQRHELPDRFGQGRATGGERGGGVPRLVRAHEFENRTAFYVLFRQAREMRIQVPDHLLFGLGHESEAPLVAGHTRDRATPQRPGIPARRDATPVASWV